MTGVITLDGQAPRTTPGNKALTLPAPALVEDGARSVRLLVAHRGHLPGTALLLPAVEAAALIETGVAVPA